MEGKAAFQLYADQIHTVQHLTDEQAGQLFKTILAYVNDQDPEPEDQLIRIAFEPIKRTLKRDLQKWRERKERNRENANKRWKMQNDATASDRTETDANDADRDRDSDRDKERDSDKDKKILLMSATDADVPEGQEQYLKTAQAFQ